MQANQPDWVWLDASESIGMSELARACGLSTQELDELVGYGALAPLETAGQTLPEPVFSAACVMTLRTAGKLRRDFDLDLFAVAMLMDYQGRIDSLERQVRALQAHLPGH